MYQALYRKYRPTNFNDVVGQDVIVRTLKNAVISNNLTHAYLFTGPRGTGKTSVAKILAKTVNCENLVEGITCDICVNCTQINQKSFVDIIEIDAASNNGVDEIRELRNKVNLVPSLGKYKVYIIDEVHMLTTGAFNALLKTLEEPPSHIIFILATTEPQKIPATILSRCQRFDFKRMADSAISDRIRDIALKENIDIGDEEIKEIARLSDGGMRDALSILDQVAAYSENKITVDDIHTVNGTLTKEKLLEFINSLAGSDLPSMLNSIENWSREGKNLYKIVEDIILLCKNILIYIEAPNYFKSNESDLPLYEKIGDIVSDDMIIKYLDILCDDLYKIKKASNPKMLLELTIIKLSEINKHKNYTSPILDNNSSNVIDLEPKRDNNQKQNHDQSVVKEEIPINREFKNKVQKLKEIRINNTLAGFDKKILVNLKSRQDDLKPLLINLDYSNYVSIILDGELKAASSDSLIYVYESEKNADLFNENIVNIEGILEHVFGQKYKVIATDIISWEIIKKEFNSKSKKYELIEEPPDVESLFNTNTNSNEIEDLFKNTIIYN